MDYGRNVRPVIFFGLLLLVSNITPLLRAASGDGSAAKAESAGAAQQPSDSSVAAQLARAFSMPVISPNNPPPPYRYHDCTALNILFKTEPAIAEKLVPPPLKFDATRPLVFYIGHYQFVDFDLPYNEAGLLVPVTYAGKPAGLFAVVLYLDKVDPIVGGRELYGWPKKAAEQVVFNEENGKVTAGVTRYGKQIITASFDAERKLETIPPRPKDTFYLLKMIPSATKGAPPDVLKLISTGIDPDVISSAQIGKATLRFGPSPYDAFLAGIPVQEVVYSEVIVHDFTLSNGETVLDYLAPSK